MSDVLALIDSDVHVAKLLDSVSIEVSSDWSCPGLTSRCRTWEWAGRTEL